MGIHHGKYKKMGIVMNAQTQLVKREETRFEMVIRTAMGLPGIKIDRAKFLQRELSKYFDVSKVSMAIESNPAQAGIDAKDMERIAKACINNETARVSALSAAAGIKGGLAIAVTVPADTVQFFGHILRILQKLAYLYGWQEILTEEDNNLNDETSNELILFMGVMFGVNAANMALSKIALLAAQNVPKQLMRQALTKGTIYPIIKKVAAAIGVKMTKPILAKSVGKAIPLVGAFLSGGITFAIFKPMASRLKNFLSSLSPANVDFYNEPLDNTIIDEIDFIDIGLDESNKEEVEQ